MEKKVYMKGVVFFIFFAACLAHGGERVGTSANLGGISNKKSIKFSQTNANFSGNLDRKTDKISNTNPTDKDENLVDSVAARAILDSVEVIASNQNINSNLSDFGGVRTLSRANLDAFSGGNHTIGDALKTTPNLNFNRKGASSSQSGSLNPQDFSINGASFYQNSFLVDGVSFSNDFNPRQRTWPHHNHIWEDSSIGAQAIGIDSDLLDRVSVHSSNISAKFGGFLGGAIDTKTRDPRREWGGVASYSYTSGKWSKKIRDESAASRYEKGEIYDLSDFIKRRVRFGADGFISENSGVLFNFSRATSGIVNHLNDSKLSPSYPFKKDERKNDNFFVKGLYEGEIWSFRPSFLYSTLSEKTSTRRHLNSNLRLDYGGYLSKIEAIGTYKNFVITNSLSYSQTHSSRDYEHDENHYFYKTSNLRACGSNPYCGVGGYTDFSQIQKNFEYKLDLNFAEFKVGDTTHTINSGLGYLLQNGIYEIPRTLKVYNGSKELPAGTKCRLDDPTCLNDDSYGGKGQFLSKKEQYFALKNRARTGEIWAYLEDEISINKFKFRPGVRAERSDFNGDLNIAPRFSLSYEFIPQNSIGVGLNRYFGRNFFAYEIYEGIRAKRKTCFRSSPSGDFVEKCRNFANDGHAISHLKTPYEDELSLFYDGRLDGVKFALQYVNRNSKNEVTSRFVPKIKDVGEHDIYTNEGKNSAKIWTFSVQNASPIEIFDVKNDLELSLTHTRKKRNFTDFMDYEMDEDVLYNGAKIKKSKLPATDYFEPFRANLTHLADFGAVKFSNSLRFYGRSKALVGGWSGKDQMYIYKEAKTPSYTIWDAKINTEVPLHDGLRGFVSLDINNVLNKKYIAKIEQDYQEFGLGRNFWVEFGMKW